MPALPCIHPPVGASLVHRRTPNCPQRPSQARMAHPAQTQYALAATQTGKPTRPRPGSPHRSRLGRPLWSWLILRPPQRCAVTDKTVAFVLYPGLTPLDLIGPLQVMSALEAVEEMFGVEPRHHVVVVAEEIDAVPTDTPVRVAATSILDDVPEPDVVVVPGGGAPTLRQLANPVLLDYLRQVDRRAELVGSVCTGALLLAGAGLLEGRRATTHIGRITGSSTAWGRRTCRSGGWRTTGT